MSYTDRIMPFLSNDILMHIRSFCDIDTKINMMKAGVTNTVDRIYTPSRSLPAFQTLIPHKLDKDTIEVYLHPYWILKNVRLNRVSVKNVTTNQVNSTMVTDDGERYGNICQLF
jgi:hypothetical protein